MTSIVVPDYVCALFEKELHSMAIKTCEALSCKYGFSVNEAETFIASRLKLTIIPEEQEMLKIVRKRQTKALTDDTQCKALVRKQGLVRRCACASKTDDGFCTRHFKKFQIDPLFDAHLREEVSNVKVQDDKKARRLRIT